MKVNNMYLFLAAVFHVVVLSTVAEKPPSTGQFNAASHWSWSFSV